MALRLNGVKKEKLVAEVIEQIKYDIAIGDVTALDELLRFCPDINLVGYLPDDVEAIARYNPNKETK